MAHLFDQPSSNETIKWRADSDLRGSFSIISTCTITLALGVWSAVHLNLPTNPGNWWRIAARRCAWIICSLFAPEALVFIAWSQLNDAKKVQQMVDENMESGVIIERDSEAQKPSLKNKWTMTHSFWVVMGGLAIDANGSEPFIESAQPPKLTPNGLWLLLQKEPQLIPDIAEEELKDKSKGDWFTKSLACIQATWFCASCLVRIGQSLPMNLLELNTFAHAICTIVVYFIWWKKPLDVERPLVIDSKRIGPLMAYMWMASKASARPPINSNNSDIKYEVGQDPEFEAITLGRRLSIPEETDAQRITPLIVQVTPNSGLPGTTFYANTSSTRWNVKKTYRPSGGGDEYSSYHDLGYTERYTEPALFKLNCCDVRRWRLAQKALDDYKLGRPTKNLNFVSKKQISELDTGPNLPWASNLAGKDRTLWPTFGFSILTACYGAFHALGWNARFPNRRERILWRVSSLLITCPAGVFLATSVHVAIAALLNKFVPSLSLLQRKQADKQDSAAPSSSSKGSTATETDPSSANSGLVKAGEVAATSGNAVQSKSKASDEERKEIVGIMVELSIKAVALLTTLAFLGLYVPARAYLVVESFRMVFYLPPDAFKATQWENYFPHIG